MSTLFPRKPLYSPSTHSQDYAKGLSTSSLSLSEDGDQPRTPLSPTMWLQTDPLLSPSSASADRMLESGHQPQPRPSRAISSTSAFISSPLNPHMPPTSSPHSSTRSRPGSSAGSAHFHRVASEETHALAGGGLQTYSQAAEHRASMVLYRLADDSQDGFADNSQEAILPPRPRHGPRNSVWSTASGASTAWSISDDSKYPGGVLGGLPRGIVAYAYDPDDDLSSGPPDEDDALHDVSLRDKRGRAFGWRGVGNIGVLAVIIAALMALFVAYPILTYYRTRTRNNLIAKNIDANATGQTPVMFNMPGLIDTDTPKEAVTRTGYDNEDYELVFSDEFSVDGRSFYPGDDPYWEAVDLWYWATNDLEWYDPAQVTTRDGALVITMENRTNHEGMQYVSGMLQSWNKFCFSSGYLEIAISLPGPDESTQGYWPGAWTMGNLGRPGYGATTDGLWPYSYSSCDVGTFPNQTYRDGSGPAAALHSDSSRSKYDYELSWLPGQRLSACTCPGEDHPGPSVSQGRGAPEIDVIEAERNKLGDQVGQVVSQSAQFAPFTHDYLFSNATSDEYTIYDSSVTTANTYRGSVVQQAVSALTRTPENIFENSGKQFAVFGFEYWANPKAPEEGFITWVSNNKTSHRMGAAAMGPDTGDGGTGVGQRLVPEEPLSIVLNLGISHNWQTISPDTMTFPAEMMVDYVRVYQRKGHENIGCNPKDYPTAEYIKNHMDAYTNPNLTGWVDAHGLGSPTRYAWPKNSLYEGGC